MNPKINGVSGGPPRVDSSKPAAAAGKPADSERAGHAAASDEVSLTDSAQLMVRLEKLLDDVPHIDRERVEAVKRAIADGSYSVDAERVAAEVLRMELNLR